MITEHLTDCETADSTEAENEKRIEVLRFSEEDSNCVREVAIKISASHAAPQLLRFYSRIEDMLQSQIAKTFGSVKDTTIRLNLEKPFSLPVLVDIIEGTPVQPVRIAETEREMAGISAR